MRDADIAWKKLPSRYERRYEKTLENEMFFVHIFYVNTFQCQEQVFRTPKFGISEIGVL